MRLNEIKVPFGAKKKKKRVGRGDGSGHGGTSTRGHKGHKARSGYKLSFNFEGGQMPLMRRLPKRGFTHIKKNSPEVVNLQILDNKFQDGDKVTPEVLKEKKIVKKGKLVKILGNGSLKKKLEVHAHLFSKKAREKIEKAGGKAVSIQGESKK